MKNKYLKTALLIMSALPVTLLFSQSNTFPGNKQGNKINSISIPAQSDEFVGPFASWTNIKTAYGAKGDGVTDDAAAIQKAFDEIKTGNFSPVLYFPSGTYLITQTLNLVSKEGISIIGEDPATTFIIWAGASGGTILNVNGLDYSRFSRLTFDGKKLASVAVEESWDNIKPYFDTGNEYSDDVFKDVEYGIHGGMLDYGFAEVSIERSHFLRNTKSAVALGNFNALDVWVWYCTFDSCNVGVTNYLGGGKAGNFHVYNSIFRKSTTADMSMGNTGGFSARGNYSIGSNYFFGWGVGTNNPATIDLQKNIILDPISLSPISFGNQGPGLITDNIIRSLPASTGPVIQWTSFNDADMESIGNTFTVANTISNNGRVISIDDKVVNRNTINIPEPVLPGTLPNFNRQVFEVPPGAIADTIQKIINKAAAQNGNRPIVHFPPGPFSINKTLIIPACDVQLAGDGYIGVTTLSWNGPGAGPLLKMNGPSKATLRELQINGSNAVDCIVIDNADQVGSRIYMDQAQLRTAVQSELFANGLDKADIHLENFGFAYQAQNAAIRAVGGPVLSTGGTAPGKINIFSGASGGNTVSYDISGGAKMLVRDIWYESGAGPGFANIHDRATFTVDACRVSTSVGKNPPAFNITGLNGKVSIFSIELDDQVTISGDGSKANVLGMGILDWQKSFNYFVNSSSPTAKALLLNSREGTTIAGTASVPTPNIGVVDTAFVRTMVSHTRGELAQPLTSLPNGITDARLFRVWVTNGINNITVQPSPDTSATTSIQTNIDKADVFTVYPNPANCKLTVSTTGFPIKNIDIFKMTGELVLSQKNNCNNCANFELDVSTLSNGIYFVRVNGNPGEQRIKKISVMNE